jgi:hypothetical protein
MLQWIESEKVEFDHNPGFQIGDRPSNWILPPLDVVIIVEKVLLEEKVTGNE